MKILATILFTFVAFISTAQAQWAKQSIDTDAAFRGLSAVNDKICWVSGTKGTVGRTIDGGKNWEVFKVPEADKLDFRDIEAFSANVAYILSIGDGENSRIYKTTDGGKNWKLQFQNKNPKAFFDALAFWDEQHGIAMSDSVDGKFVLISTDNGGASWNEFKPEKIPTALPNEGGFAASGTCIIAKGKNDVWMVTGKARVLHSSDRGKNWDVVSAPILTGIDSAGIFSIDFKDNKNGIIVGGDYREFKPVGKTLAITSDGGKTWTANENQLPFRSGMAYTKDSIIAVGTSGSNISKDGGKTWAKLNDENYNVVSVAKSGAVWAAGPKGLISKLMK
jgi:photosystem II stability/assembly factor-like uncharacterized protein